MPQSKYQELGVDAVKGKVREIYGRINRQEYPGAFVNIATCPWDNDQVITQHVDGDGSKFVQRALMHETSGDATVFQGVVDDAVSMNSGDIAAAGFVFGPWFMTNVTNINGKKLPKDKVLEQLALRFESLMELYRQYGFDISIMGGETADLPDQVQSGVADVTITAITKKAGLITGNVQPFDIIYGFSSDGQAVWEDGPNSGIMSNGLTLARTYLMATGYSEMYPHLIQAGGRYQGRYGCDEEAEGIDLGMTVGEALASPTRQWAILIKILLSRLELEGLSDQVHGITMNTGGGATKIGHLGQGGIRYEKRMPPVPPIFQLVQRESGESWKDMYQGMNCGIGLDVVIADHSPKKYRVAGILREVSQKTGVVLRQLGTCRARENGNGKNSVSLETDHGQFEYEL